MSFRPNHAAATLTSAIECLREHIGPHVVASTASIGVPKLFQPLVEVIACAGALESATVVALRLGGFEGNVNFSPLFSAARTVREEAVDALYQGLLSGQNVLRWRQLMLSTDKPAF